MNLEFGVIIYQLIYRLTFPTSLHLRLSWFEYSHLIIVHTDFRAKHLLLNTEDLILYVCVLKSTWNGNRWLHVSSNYAQLLYLHGSLFSGHPRRKSAPLMCVPPWGGQRLKQCILGKLTCTVWLMRHCSLDWKRWERIKLQWVHKHVWNRSVRGHTHYLFAWFVFISIRRLQDCGPFNLHANNADCSEVNL